jgi:hypothetical protein
MQFRCTSQNYPLYTSIIYTNKSLTVDLSSTFFCESSVIYVMFRFNEIPVTVGDRH